jgi:zinc/manganese transport system permease protein
MLTAGRWAISALLVASAVELAVAPRADQPVLDAFEAAFPSARGLYFTKPERATYFEAALYADRYYAEAERLNAMEKQSRTGAALDDAAVAKLSSYLKSSGEMRKGEQFVMQEVRARARERMRWLLSPALLVLAALCAPIRLRSMLRRAWT